MQKYTETLLLLILTTGMFACGSGNDDDSGLGDNEDAGTTDDAGESELDAGVEAKSFRFVVISDTHVRLPGNPDDGEYDPVENLDNLQKAVERINREYAYASFVAVTGDLVGCLFSENSDDYGTGDPNPADKFKELMDGLSMPYYIALGNHDYQKNFDADNKEGISTDNITAIESVWEKVLSIKPYYSVVYEGVRLVFLNANRGNKRTEVCAGAKAEAFCTGSFDNEQIAWMNDELSQGNPTIIFVHHPPITDSSKALFSFSKTFLIAEGDPFYKTVEDNKNHIMAIFAGHGHVWEHDTLFDVIQVYETGPIGDTNGNSDNLHIVDFNPTTNSLTVTIGREGLNYWSDRNKNR